MGIQLGCKASQFNSSAMLANSWQEGNSYCNVIYDVMLNVGSPHLNYVESCIRLCGWRVES